jgi:outer membrane immunogenic protein
VGPAIFGANIQTDTRSGWTVGGGFDYALTNASLMPGWSARVEYLYVNIPSYNTFTPGTGSGLGLTCPCATLTNLTTGKLTNNIIRVGLTYKFGNYAGAYR